MLALTSSIETPYHRWRAAHKLGVVALAVLGLYFMQSPILLAAATALVALAYLIAGRAFLAEGIKLLRPLWVFVAVVMVWHAIAGDPVTGVAVSLRLAAAVGLANLVTMTTRLDDLKDVVMWLLTPFKRLGIRTKPIGFAMTLVIRFTPVLLQKARMLVLSWRARSARRPGWPIVMPMALIALDDADRVAEALRARGGFDTDT